MSDSIGCIVAVRHELGSHTIMNNNKNKKASKMQKKQSLPNGVTFAPLARTRTMKTGTPSMSQSGFASDGRIRVTHREYLGDILGSVAFTVNKFSINPGLNTTFPWLAPIANQYESYLIRKMSFEYETQKSANTSGTIMLGVDYDASDANPVSKQQLMSYHDSVRSAVWSECKFVCDIRDLQKFGVQRYLRGGVLAANLDVKTFDVGNLFVATQGCADATAIGELYVTYDLELITPQSDPAGEALSESANISSLGTISRTACFGLTPTIVGGLPVTALSSTLTFNRVGNYLLTNLIGGTVLTGTSPTITGTATTTYKFGVANAAADTLIQTYLIKVNNSGETVALDFTPSCTTLTAGQWRIGSYNYALN